MTQPITTLHASHLLRRLHTLLTLGKRSNNLALAIRKALEEMASWNPVTPFADAFTKPPKIVFAGYGPKFIKMIGEIIETGNIALLDTLQNDYSVFFCELCELPGIGETVARRMFYDKMIESFDDLCVATANHILRTIPGFGETRIKIIERWVYVKSHDPNAFPADLSLDQNLTIASDTNEIDEIDDSFFDHELDDALKRDLEALTPNTPRKSCDSCIEHELLAIEPRNDARKTSVTEDSTFIDLDASCALPLSSELHSLINYALSLSLPSAFITRFVAQIRQSDAQPAHVLIYGSTMTSLVDCLAKEVTSLTVADDDFSTLDLSQKNIVTRHFDELVGKYDVIFIDPIRFGSLTHSLKQTLQPRLSPIGILVYAAIDIAYTQFLPHQLRFAFKNMIQNSVEHKIEQTEFISICIEHFNTNSSNNSI